MPRGLAKKTLALIAIAHELLSRIQPATVRGVCYQLFNQKLLPDMSKRATDRVALTLTTARERGLIAWEWIVAAELALPWKTGQFLAAYLQCDASFRPTSADPARGSAWYVVRPRRRRHASGEAAA